MIALLVAIAVQGASAAVPADVRRFEARYIDCAHWLGEEPYDAARRAEIDAAVRRACTGIDRDRASLLDRYRRRPAILKILRRHPPIEG